VFPENEFSRQHFKLRRTSSSKTYGTAGKPCPFKNPTARVFPQAVKR